MRCADLTPTPGIRRKAATRPSSDASMAISPDRTGRRAAPKPGRTPPAGSVAASAASVGEPLLERQLHAGRQRHARRELAHLLLAHRSEERGGGKEGGTRR